MDVLVLGILDLEGVYLNVTIRRPRDKHYSLHCTGSVDGVACDKAPADKQSRYGACGAGHVIALVAEHWGRLSTDAEHVLAVCVASAARLDHRRAHCFFDTHSPLACHP